MKSVNKKIIGSLVIAGAVTGAFYLIKKGRKLLPVRKMNFAFIGFRIHKLNLKEVQFAVKLRCYNPTNSPVTLAINQVVANYNNAAIAYSKPNIKGITIQGGATQEPEILFQVPYLNLAGKGFTKTLLENIEQLKAGMSFTLTMTINNQSITTTQTLTQENMNGLATASLGIVSGKRNIQDGTKYNKLIKRAEGESTYLKNGNVLETVEACIEMVADHYLEVEQLAKTLKTGNLKDTCRNIFNFAYNYLQYQKDEDGTEQLRSPARSWLDGQIKYKQKNRLSSGIDCDDYSIFCGSILKCLGIPFKFRITKYDGKTRYQHIYIFVPCVGDSEDEIIIDPVLDKFDFQKPYSFERSDFNMSPLQLIAGIRGIDGITGSSSLGLPIYALSGVDFVGGRMPYHDHNELMAIISGLDFEDSFNGLGTPDDAALRYLIRTRDFLLRSEDNKNKMAHIQNPDQFIKMIDEAIKYWNTPQRHKVLDKLADIEERLIESGLIKYDIEAIEGIQELDDIEDELDGLERLFSRSRRKKRRARRKKRRGKFFRALKHVGKKAWKVTKKIAKAVVRFNPLTITMRTGLLAAIRLNIFGVAKKMQYVFLPDNLASKYNIDVNMLRKLKKRYKLVRKLFKGLQGKEKYLRRAILKGAKQKSPDFSLKGTNGILEQLQGLEAMGELAELGNLGAAVTASSVAAASGLLAKISGWLKPVKNIFKKVKNKIFKRKKKTTSKTSQSTPVAQETGTEPKPKSSPPSQPKSKASSQSGGASQNNTPSQKASYPPARSNYIAPVQPVNTTPPPPKKGLSKGAKIGIGIGVAALLGTGIYYLTQKDDKEEKSDKKEKKPQKSLGEITLQ